jgi:pimeloyl-ACP methyl ester carboxylesterase
MLNDVVIHYLQIGAGPDLVMVHGLGSSLAQWNLSIAPALARRRRVTTYDMRGHGWSDMPKTGYALSSMVSDLASLLDVVGISAAAIVGHSFGGGVALAFALRHPSRVRALVLADAAIPSLARLAEGCYQSRAGRIVTEVRGDRSLPIPEDADSAFMLISELVSSPKDIKALRREVGAFFIPFGPWSRAGGAAKRWRKLVSETSAMVELAKEQLASEDVRRLEIPVLLFYGELSRYMPVCETLSRLLPRCRTVLAPGAGHFHPVVRPEPFSSTVADFLSECAQ